LKRRATAVVSVVASLVLGAGQSAAQNAEPTANPTRARRVVTLEATGAFEQGAVLQDTLRELLGRLGLSVDARGTAPPDDVLAYVRIDHDEAGANVSVRDARKSGEPARKRVPRSDSTAVFREALAHVVLGAVEPLTTDDAAKPRPEPPEARPTPPASPPASPARRPAPREESASPWAFGVGTAGGGTTLGSTSGFVVAIGGGVSLAHRGGLNPTVTLAGRYAFPFDGGDDVVQAHVNVTSLRLTPEIEVLRAGAFGLALGAGLGVDVLGVTPRSPVLPASRLGPSTTRADPVIAPSVMAKLALAKNVDVVLLVAVDVDLARPSWVSDAGGTRTAVFAPARARPFVGIGLDFTVAGAGRSAEAARGGER
jgi:hypothetical protein